MAGYQSSRPRRILTTVIVAFYALTVLLSDSGTCFNVGRSSNSVDLFADHARLASVADPSNLPTLGKRDDEAFYAVLPEDSGNHKETDQIDELLRRLAVSGKVEATRSTCLNNELLFWIAKLKSSDAETVKNNDKVLDVIKQCSSNCRDPTKEPDPTEGDEVSRDLDAPTTTANETPSKVKRSRFELVRQSPANKEMMFLSQDPEKRAELGFLKENYIYDKSAGDWTTVYVVDTGAELDHKEFKRGKNIANRASWILVGGEDEKKNDSDDTGHGTCMLGKVAGHLQGVAKDINPIIVRVPKERRLAWMWLSGVVLALNDYCDKHAQGTLTKAVINMSFHIKPTDPGFGQEEVFASQLSRVLKKGIEKGLFPVTGAGNDVDRTITGYPAVLAKTRPDHPDWHVPELMVVGATNDDGTVEYVPTNSDPDITLLWAPGFLIRCADSKKFTEDQLRTSPGTSGAAASVAGLAAYFLGLDSLAEHNSPAKLDEYMRELAYERDEARKLRAIWNGVELADYNNDPNSPPLRPDGASDNVAPAPTASTAPDPPSIPRVPFNPIKKCQGAKGIVEPGFTLESGADAIKQACGNGMRSIVDPEREFEQQPAAIGIDANPKYSLTFDRTIDSVFYGYKLQINATWFGRNDGCVPVNFRDQAAQATEVCNQKLHEILDSCDTKKETELWKKGGIYDDGCVQWSLQRAS